MTHEFNENECKRASALQREWSTRLIAERDLWGTKRVLDSQRGVHVPFQGMVTCLRVMPAAQRQFYRARLVP